MNISRRSFLAGGLVAAAVVATPFSWRFLWPGTYYMDRGSTLLGLTNSNWRRIVMADDCVIRNCQFKSTEIVFPEKTYNCWIVDCVFTQPPRFGIFSARPATNIRVTEIGYG